MLHTDIYTIAGPGLDAFSFPENAALLVVGDAHGQSGALRDLLDLTGQMTTPGKRRTLVFLGDLIDRGPDSTGCLDAAFHEAGHRAAADTVAHLPGNHELMLADTLDAVAKGPDFARMSEIPGIWLMNGGWAFLAEAIDIEPRDDMIAMTDKIPALADMLATRFPGDFARIIRGWPSHVRLGDALCVHAGIRPKRDQAATLDKPQNGHLSDIDHWAWIRDPFLKWQRGWPLDASPDRGALVLHGHTAPATVRVGKSITQDSLREVFCRMHTNARICLDGGSAQSVGVAGAVLTSDGVRLLFAPV